MTTIYVENLLNALRDLSDIEFQKQAWLSSGTQPVSSFTEDVCQTFDDTGLGKAMDNGTAGEIISSEAINELWKLRQEINVIDGFASPHEVINSEAMKIVRARAKKVLRMLQSRK